MKNIYSDFAGLFTKRALAKGGTTTVTVPAGHIYYLMSAAITYACDATVANRLIIVRSSVDTPREYLAYNLLTASQSGHIMLGIQSILSSLTVEWFGLPAGGYPMIGGRIYGVYVTDGQAGDTWTGQFVYRDVLKTIGS